MFVANRKPKSLLFNKSVTEERIAEVRGKLNELLDGWYPKFNNLNALYEANGEKWEHTPIPEAKTIGKTEAWASMPQAAIDFLRELPEFDADVFFEVTGIQTQKEETK